MASVLFCHIRPVFTVCFRLSDLSRHLLNELGSALIQNVKFRDMWVFVGYKGIKGFTDIEQVNLFLELLMKKGIGNCLLKSCGGGVLHISPILHLSFLVTAKVSIN